MGTSCSEATFQWLMKHEMQFRPLKIAAACAFAILTGTVLVLLVILEIQWIRLSGIRIRKERAKVA